MFINGDRSSKRARHSFRSAQEAECAADDCNSTGGRKIELVGGGQYREGEAHS